MKKKVHYIYFIVVLLLSLLSTGCTDSIIDNQFKASLTDRQATFSLDVSTSTINVGPTLSSQSFSVMSTDSWSASSSEDWISFTSSSGNRDGQVAFTVQENASDQSRIAKITVSGSQSNLSRIVTVTQIGMTLTVEPRSLEFSYEGGVKTVEVTTVGRYKVENNADWLSCEISDNIVKITAKPNPEIEKREASISIVLEGSSLSSAVSISQNGGSGISIKDFGSEEVL